MISLVCQKSPGGTINYTEKDAHHLIEDSKITQTTESLASKKFKSTDYRVKPRPNSYHVSRNTHQSHGNKQVSTNMTTLIERPASSYITTSDVGIPKREGRISAKKLQQVQNWINEQIIKKNHYLNSINKSKKRISLHEFYLQKVKEETKLNEDLNVTLAENELKTQQKKELIYRDWLCSVYEPLKRELTKIQDNTYEQDVYLRDLNYVEYLKQVNKRGAVYQDDYDPSDYNPFKHLIRQNSKKSKTRKFIANIHERKLQKENSIISNFDNENESKRLLGLRCSNTRSDINWDQWLKEKYNDIESTERIKSGLKCKPVRNNSKINLAWTNDNVQLTKRSPKQSNASVIEVK